MGETDKHLRFVPLNKATIPPSGLIEHFKDCYWVVHPKKGVVFWKHSPQCNANKVIADRIAEHMYPWAEVKLMASVLRRSNGHDYG